MSDDAHHARGIELSSIWSENRESSRIARIFAAQVEDNPLHATSTVMCNLYSQTRNIEAIRRLFLISYSRTTRIDPQPAIFPGWNGSVIRWAEMASVS